jgi:Tfp pilus assembly protein PilZ
MKLWRLIQLPILHLQREQIMAQPNSEDRDEPRFDHSSHLQVKDLGTGGVYEARMRNFSDGGIYFESDGLFQKGTKIYICMQNSPYAQSSGVLEYYTGEVMWRNDLKRSFFKYGYGIQLGSDSRKHPRTPYVKKLRFSTDKGIHEGKTKNISASGIFIATEEKLEVGQIIRFNLPLGKDKTAMIKGQIMWLNAEGFGLKFQKVK